MAEIIFVIISKLIRGQYLQTGHDYLFPNHHLLIIHDHVLISLDNIQYV